MSTDRETTRIVRSWLDEGVTKLPDRVLDAVLDQVPATPQRRSGWSAWRSYRMNTYAKIVAAAAAVLVVGVAAYQFLPRSGGVGGPGLHKCPALCRCGCNTLPARRAGQAVWAGAAVQDEVWI